MLKIDRLLGIVTLLLQREKMTAPELAEHFEVSRRTITRDINSIAKSGIPIYTTQGIGGGISILDSFKLEKQLLSKDELLDIIIGLKGINSIAQTSNTEKLLNKITPTDDSIISLKDSIIIDLASYYKDSLSTKINSIKKAITAKRCIQFTYYSKKGESIRTVEPYFIAFKWLSWYIVGYCTLRNDFRMFKLNRLRELQITDINFCKRDYPIDILDFDSHFIDDYELEALFDKSVKYRLLDEYGKDCFTEEEDYLYVKLGYTNKDYIISWILSFGNMVTVISPKSLVEDIKNTIDEMKNNY